MTKTSRAALTSLLLALLLVAPSLAVAQQGSPTSADVGEPDASPNGWAMGMRLSPGAILGLGGLGGLGELGAPASVLVSGGLGERWRLEAGVSGAYSQSTVEPDGQQDSISSLVLGPSLGLYYLVDVGPAARLYAGLQAAALWSSFDGGGLLGGGGDAVRLTGAPTTGLEYVFGRRLGLALELGLQASWRRTDSPLADQADASRTDLNASTFGRLALRFYF